MSMLLLPLEGAFVNETPIPAPFIGLIMFAALMFLLQVVRGIGHSRVHSEGDSSQDH